MEIIFELLFQLVAWIFQFIAELLLQVVGEFIADLIGHSVKKPFRRRKPVDPWFAAIGYFIFGALAGALSLWLFPALFVQAAWLRIANLILTPVAAGAIMAHVGTWRVKRGRDAIRLEKFAYGFCFAFAMALVRFAWGS